MKRFYCVCLAFLLCLGICGCQKEYSEPESGLPNLSADEMEKVVLEEQDYVYGEIIEKIAPDVLVLKTGTLRMTEAWGETVYIITNQTDEWKVGSEIEVYFREVHRPHDTEQYVRMIADEVKPLMLYYKPVIYLYPEVPTVCSVKVGFDGELTCTYPTHGANGWGNFTAHPDGTLVFPDGKEYYALYWEGVQTAKWDFSTGYCVRGKDTAAFLEWALAQQGLTQREANEFIIYWLPLMQENPYNVISFQTKAYTGGVALDIVPAPDSLLRVFMAYYPADTMLDIQPQTFDNFVREGFTVVEWGGSQSTRPEGNQ